MRSVMHARSRGRARGRELELLVARVDRVRDLARDASREHAHPLATPGRATLTGRLEPMPSAVGLANDLAAGRTELSRLERALERGDHRAVMIAARTDTAAATSMRDRVRGAHTTMAGEDAIHVQKLRAASTKAHTTIAKAVERARTRIAATNREAIRDIAGAGKRGRQAIAKTGADAKQALVDFSEARQSTDVLAAKQDLQAYDARAATLTKQLVTMANGREGPKPQGLGSRDRQAPVTRSV